MPLEILEKLGYTLYRDGRLNIIAVRKKPFAVNTFNDELHIFNNGEISWQAKVTTLPGKYWLSHLMNPKGSAILKPGEYLNSWQLGKHKGKDALIQCRPVTVYRDKNLDDTFDYTHQESGMFGINIHRAGSFSHLVNSWSAGCQVFQAEEDFERFLYFCKEKANLHKGLFSYTLIEQE